MATFRWSEEYVCEEQSGAKMWAYYNWALENRATVFGSVIERVTPGYVARELDLILKRKRP